MYMDPMGKIRYPRMGRCWTPRSNREVATDRSTDPEAASHLEMMLFLCPGEGTAAGHHHFEQLDQQQHCESLVEGFGTLGQRSWEQSADANLHDVRFWMVWMFIGIGTFFWSCQSKVKNGERGTLDSSLGSWWLFYQSLLQYLVHFICFGGMDGLSEMAKSIKIHRCEVAAPRTGNIRQIP